MLDTPAYALADEGEVRNLIRTSPWATLVSATPGGLIASHYPFLLDETASGIVLLSHVGADDAALHELGQHETLVIFEGPNGYVSPSWYGRPTGVPTWNYAAVHVYGRPRILSAHRNLEVLERLVDHFEDPLPNPFRMRGTLENSAYADRISVGTTGFALPVDRFVGKEKMSQDKPGEVVARIIETLRQPGPYRNPALADRMAGVNSALRNTHRGYPVTP
ncbi:FMN-binding negative transcriptional regulator [Kineosporia mesophila]|uniref:FMN-binding negative transcriptional regulator n=1 Tax=Kineosporia mesophila TaxID=566012 RepID=A0ABP7AEY1_9ACTN|nr:FMN-binding negative transcriptional regulator [Kineosporia mesophila]MCD5352876.1 FMN-binding negative transcriptional regulator [Kineosporia mesophila]